MNPTTPSQELRDLLTKARTLLLIDHPFFASVVLRKPIMWTLDIPTAACSPRGQIYINPEWVTRSQMTAKNLIFLLAHEAMHYMLLHGVRRGVRKPAQWNIACDKVINDTLIACGCGTFIEGGTTQDGARNHSAEELYSEADDDGGGGPGGIGSDLLEHDPDGGGESLTDGEISEIEAQAKIDMVQAKQAAKMQGKLPGVLEQLVDSIIEVKTPWDEVLERFMSNFRRDDTTWSRPNRRFVAEGVYMPGINYVPEMGPVVIGVDESGSISHDELKCYAGHVNRILEAARPERVYVLHCSAEVSRVEELTVDDLPWVPKSGVRGGTDLRAIFDWVDTHGVAPDAAIILTDMYTPFPDQAPDYATVWVSTSTKTDAPFGEVIQYVPDK